MVRCVPRRGDSGERPAWPGDAVAFNHHRVRRIGRIEPGIGARAIIGQHQRRAADDFRTGCRLQRRCRRAVVHMGVGNDDMADGFAVKAGDECGDMRRIGRARIDHRNRAAAHNKGAGAGKGERRRVMGEQAPHKGRPWHKFAPGGGIGVLRKVHGAGVAGYAGVLKSAGLPNRAFARKFGVAPAWKSCHAPTLWQCGASDRARLC